MSGEMVFQHYLVVFLDILGQRRTLREITDIPTDENGIQQFKHLTRETLGKILSLREAFQAFFGSSKSHSPNVNLVFLSTARNS